MKLPPNATWLMTLRSIAAIDRLPELDVLGKTVLGALAIGEIEQQVEETEPIYGADG